METYSEYVEFYLYPTVGTVLIHSVKPEFFFFSYACHLP